MGLGIPAALAVPGVGPCNAACTRGRDALVDDPSAALLIRVWFEGAGEFRARLLALRDATPEAPAEEVTVAVASSPGGVLEAVRDWLDDFSRRAADRGGKDR
jgi:hypothetical protein